MRKSAVDNPRYPHEVKVIRKYKASEDNNPMRRAETETADLIIYKGDGRGFTDTTTTGDSEVDSNKRKASIPVRFDKWTDDTATGRKESVPDGEPCYPLDGDTIEIVKGTVITETGEVKDFEPDNDRTLIYWELTRN